MPPSATAAGDGPAWASSAVAVFTSQTMQTTSTVVINGTDAVLVDPCWEPAELAAIADWLAAHGLRVALGWATHAHHDHVLWHPRFGAAPRLATPAAASTASAHRSEIRAALGAWPADLLDLAGAVRGCDGAELPWAGSRVEVVAHDAHAPGHGALWLANDRVLIAGDMLSDTEIPLLAETGYAAYAAGLDALAPYVAQARVLIGGHGTIARAGAPDSPAARLAADRAYLAALLELPDGGAHLDPRLTSGPGWLGEEHARNLAAAHGHHRGA